jgi:hypothetical protein
VNSYGPLRQNPNDSLFQDSTEPSSSKHGLGQESLLNSMKSNDDILGDEISDVISNHKDVESTNHF